MLIIAKGTHLLTYSTKKMLNRGNNSDYSVSTWRGALLSPLGYHRSLPEELSPHKHLAACPQFSPESTPIFSAHPSKHSSHSLKAYLLLVPEVVCLALQPLGFCGPTAFLGSKVKMLGEQECYLAPFLCSSFSLCLHSLP